MRGSRVSTPTTTSTSEPLLERLRDAAAPVRRQPGDEDAHRRAYPNHTLRRVRSMS